MTTSGAPSWIELFTQDPESARAFYGDLFGWASTKAGEEYGGYVTFTRNGETVAGCMENDGTQGSPSTWSVYLHTDDIQATAEKIRTAGGQLYVEPMQVGDQGHMLVAGDPAGATVGAWQPVNHPGFAARGEVGAPSWFETYTKDFAASVAFYRDAFDWEVESVGDTDEFRYSTQGSGEAALAGIMDGTAFLPADVPAHWTFYVEVADTDATLARATELGGRAVDGPDDTPYGRLATIADPQGVTFRVMQSSQRS